MLQVSELPVISGQKVIKTLVKMGFVVVRQRSSHVFLQRGENTVTVPLHNPLKKNSEKHPQTIGCFSRIICYEP
ncbi:type II toxin-antitoxin system HicA family toxin [Methanohalophilus portucalensis]|uniref:type II toxin-antitoxin system HicA family toxin n=2 Tax=Methanohalophilus portucalensis TaxID=39664 RepID=UPI00373FCAB7